MNRRCLLAGGGLAIFGGYVGVNWYHSPTVPDGMAVESLYVSRDVLVDSPTMYTPDREIKPTPFEDAYLIEEPETFSHDVRNLEAPTRFIDDTDFDEAYVVIVQYGTGPDDELRLERVDRTRDGIALEVAVDPPWLGGHQTRRIHSLLCRIRDEHGGVPETVSLSITRRERRYRR